jgi:enamine deaminase RidA (YjgF/YER057c/UK114 family)
VLEFTNLPNVHAPLGLYGHTVIAPGGTELDYLSCQLGVCPNGSTAGSIAEQADQVFGNIDVQLRAP